MSHGCDEGNPDRIIMTMPPRNSGEQLSNKESESLGIQFKNSRGQAKLAVTLVMIEKSS